MPTLNVLKRSSQYLKGKMYQLWRVFKVEAYKSAVFVATALYGPRKSIFHRKDVFLGQSHVGPHHTNCEELWGTKGSTNTESRQRSPTWTQQLMCGEETRYEEVSSSAGGGVLLKRPARTRMHWSQQPETE